MMMSRQNIAALFVFLLLFAAVPQHAARADGLCESGSDASDAINDMLDDMTDDWNNLQEQEQNFIDKKLFETARIEMEARLKEFSNNFAKGMGVFWRDHYYPAMKPFVAQISQARTIQTMDIGKMVDGEIANEIKMRKDAQQIKAEEAAKPLDELCQVDSMAVTKTAAALQSPMIAQGLVQDNQPRLLNSKPAGAPPAGNGLNRFQYDVATAASKGPDIERKVLYQEYKDYFCDPDSGDQGCTTPGVLAGKSTDLPALLWGDKQSINMSDENNRRVVAAVVRNVVAPSSPPLVPASIIGTSVGNHAILKQRARTARLNTVANALTQMIAERAETSESLPGLADIRVASGVPFDQTSSNPSYREIQEAMSRDITINPMYVASLVGSPLDTMKKQLGGLVSSLQGQRSIKMRLDEAIAVQAAVLGSQLDQELPDSGIKQAPVKSQ